jgi:hypothetical protein
MFQGQRKPKYLNEPLTSCKQIKAVKRFLKCRSHILKYLKFLFHIENNCHTYFSYNLLLANTSAGQCTEQLPYNFDINIIVVTVF